MKKNIFLLLICFAFTIPSLAMDFPKEADKSALSLDKLKELDMCVDIYTSGSGYPKNSAHKVCRNLITTKRIDFTSMEIKACYYTLSQHLNKVNWFVMDICVARQMRQEADFYSTSKFAECKYDEYIDAGSTDRDGIHYATRNCITKEFGDAGDEFDRLIESAYDSGAFLESTRK